MEVGWKASSSVVGNQLVIQSRLKGNDERQRVCAAAHVGESGPFARAGVKLSRDSPEPTYLKDHGTRGAMSWVECTPRLDECRRLLDENAEIEGMGNPI